MTTFISERTNGIVGFSGGRSAEMDILPGGNNAGRTEITVEPRYQRSETAPAAIRTRTILRSYARWRRLRRTSSARQGLETFTGLAFRRGRASPGSTDGHCRFSAVTAREVVTLAITRARPIRSTATTADGSGAFWAFTATGRAPSTSS